MALLYSVYESVMAKLDCLLDDICLLDLLTHFIDDKHLKPHIIFFCPCDEVYHDNCLIKQFTYPIKLFQITTLKISSPIKNFGTIANLHVFKNIRTLCVSISDYNKVQKYMKIHKKPSLSYNYYYNIHCMQHLTNIHLLKHLEELDIRRNDISSLDGIQECINLKNLLLSSNNIIDMTPISNLKHLKHLNIADNPINTLDAITFLNLEYLMFNDTIHDLTPIKNMTNLKKLSCHHAQNITSLDALRNLVNLEEIYMSHGQYDDLTPLVNLVNLTDLEIQYSKVMSLEPIYNIIKSNNINVMYSDTPLAADNNACIEMTKIFSPLRRVCHDHIYTNTSFAQLSGAI